MNEIDVAIIGGGPGGLTAALYAARARAKTVVFEQGIPGGPDRDDRLGRELSRLSQRDCPGRSSATSCVAQAEEFGAEIKSFTPVEKIEPVDLDFKVTADGEEYLAKTVIVATGAVPRKLGIPGEAEFTGRGVSWCATCDGALFKDKTVCVVGGGDAAVEEAMFLTKFASKVYLIHRRDELRATKCIQERCFENPKIEMKWSRIPTEIKGEDNRVVGVELQATNGDEDEFLPLDGVFIFVGVNPVNALATDLLDLDENGYIKIDHDGRTTWPGIFAAGDVTDSELKQVVTAAAKGASAAFEALRMVDEKVCSI